ncbi:ComF family protein [Bathymodiolus septemdierum thioautotrophic gill symbiont]|uniref:Competence protein F n=1 Tax=endosymbiont of Bathymodiolus septemdierum str. Myojin knoll TaxID=1303921 RepID=A0A0P0UTH6_9GAMM|nr:ComF family protein [Bathymodiolus septemdierum thioautotrophic gill symbiont]BAS68428.1 competence protein F [endosymbiont of Bathymodiolus septemdierum str. Myojin knoll]
MGIYQGLILKQTCVLCSEQANFCICDTCAQDFSSSPQRCKTCAYPITGHLDFCIPCLTNSPAFNRTYTLYDYQGAIAQLIKDFKYNQQFCIGNYFARQLYTLYQTLPTYDAILPMPLSKQRIKQRGFNQTLEFLRKIQQRTKTPIDIRSVQRIKATQPLFELTPEQRRAEIKGAFSVTSMPYKKILLVDDIITTGASLNELAITILKNTQVTHCDVMTLARAE